MGSEAVGAGQRMTATFDALSQLAASTEGGGGSEDRQGARGSDGWCNQSSQGVSYSAAFNYATSCSAKRRDIGRGVNHGRQRHVQALRIRKKWAKSSIWRSQPVIHGIREIIGSRLTAPPRHLSTIGHRFKFAGIAVISPSKCGHIIILTTHIYH